MEVVVNLTKVVYVGLSGRFSCDICEYFSRRVLKNVCSGTVF